jgi:hypothetical protein
MGGTRLPRILARVKGDRVSTRRQERPNASRVDGGRDAPGQLVEDADVLRILEILAEVGRRQRAIDLLEQGHSVIERVVIIDQVLRPKGVRQGHTTAELYHRTKGSGER